MKGANIPHYPFAGYQVLSSSKIPKRCRISLDSKVDIFLEFSDFSNFHFPAVNSMFVRRL